MTKTFDPTKPCTTRDGRKVRILATDRKGGVYPIVGLVLDSSLEIIRVWAANGKYLGSGESALDLINTPEKVRVTGWMNVYREPATSFHGTGIWATRLAADRNALEALEFSRHRIACVPVDMEVEVGQGLDR